MKIKNSNGVSRWAIGIFITIFLAALMYTIGRVDKNSDDISDIESFGAVIEVQYQDIIKRLNRIEGNPDLMLKIKENVISASLMGG